MILKAIESPEELDVAFGAKKTNCGCCSLWEKLGVILLYMLFVDLCLHFYSLCSQHKCGNVFFDLLDPDNRVLLQQQNKRAGVILLTAHRIYI